MAIAPTISAPPGSPWKRRARKLNAYRPARIAQTINIFYAQPMLLRTTRTTYSITSRMMSRGNTHLTHF